MRFSVIVPVYKVEKYLSTCIDSILGQQYSDYELILVDDGSPDRCPEICDEYSLVDSRIKVIHKENGGSSSARNEGLKVAKGDYIVYLDSDDFFADEYCLSKLASKTSSNADIIIYKTASCDEKGEYISYPQMDYSFNQEKCTLAEMVVLTVKGEEFQTSAWSKSVRRDLLISKEITFKEDLVSAEDIDWYLQVIRQAKSYAIVDDYLYVYRSRPGSITKTFGIKNLTDLLWTLEKWTKILMGGGTYLDKSLCHYIGKTYTSVLIVYATIKDKKRNEYKQQVKEYSYLLNFDNYPRTHTIKKFYRLFGFDGTILALQMLLRIRK